MPAPKRPGRDIPLPHPDDIAARKALAAAPPAPLERVLRQAEASRRWYADQLRESRANHPLKTHAEAITQMRRIREAMDESPDGKPL
ncbi:MAG: hypothetical protein EAZ65_00665 [Verrucomicrobia bacterium]|nr:MAG: hypothetical protein EAZ84_05400 [Verrucomicrobiota bacterium]TAE89275.1 MAG: hypothetical protein EAZ82_01230 [Verrucomicrobiota bacterium]TAF27851.1 MAG: hypothetical protein EAZ71_00670 [Verrucomicrobiota bacterium]TAF42700.1 MAG: hypothetical protein EAZ65_00665 [Verrucomicrobiota bacterium]